MAEYKQLKDLPVWNRSLELSELARSTITPLRAHVAEIRDRLVEARDKLKGEQAAAIKSAQSGLELSDTQDMGEGSSSDTEAG